MKNFVLISIILFLSSCGLFRKIERTKTENTTQQASSSQTQSNEVDTSTTTTTEHWKITMPGIDKSPLPTWQPGPVPDLS